MSLAHQGWKTHLTKLSIHNITADLFPWQMHYDGSWFGLFQSQTYRVWLEGGNPHDLCHPPHFPHQSPKQHENRGVGLSRINCLVKAGFRRVKGQGSRLWASEPQSWCHLMVGWHTFHVTFMNRQLKHQQNSAAAQKRPARMDGGKGGRRHREEGRKETDLWLCDKDKLHPSSSGFKALGNCRLMIRRREEYPKKSDNRKERDCKTQKSKKTSGDKMQTQVWNAIEMSLRLG